MPPEEKKKGGRGKIRVSEEETQLNMYNEVTVSFKTKNSVYNVILTASVHGLKKKY